MYLPFHCKGYKYPVIAKSYMENQDVAQLKQLYDPAWLTSGVSYRPLRPRYLCFLKEKGFEVRPVKSVCCASVYPSVPLSERQRPARIKADKSPPVKGDDVPYVFIAYTTDHFNCTPPAGSKKSPDLVTLTTLAVKVTEHLRKSALKSGKRAPEAFWLAHQCTPHNRYANDEGIEIPIAPEDKALIQKLKNEDVS